MAKLFHTTSAGSCRARTTRNNCCVFPFIYRGRRYTSCTTVRSRGRPWCALTPNYDVDKLWGRCRGKGGEGEISNSYRSGHEQISLTIILAFRNQDSFCFFSLFCVFLFCESRYSHCLGILNVVHVYSFSFM